MSKGWRSRAVNVLRDPVSFRVLGERGAELIAERYALGVTLPRLLALFERVVGAAEARCEPDPQEKNRSPSPQTDPAQPSFSQTFRGPGYVGRIAFRTPR